jgi:hypothetical protein
VWDYNDGADAKNKLTNIQYVLKALMRVTKNTSIMYNLEAFLEAIKAYVKLHHSLFGKYQGELMQKPSAFVLNKTSGSFKDFLDRELLQPLYPLFLVIHTGQGYGYIDEIPALSGLMWNTPVYVITLALRIFDINDIYIFKNGYEHVIKTIVKKEKFDIRFNTTIQNIVRTDGDVSIHYKNTTSDLLMEKCGFLIWSPPMPQLVNYLSNPAQREHELFTPLSCHGVVASVMRAKGTVRNNPFAFYRESLENKIDGGIVADMDVEATLNYCETNCNLNLEKYNSMSSSSRVITVFQLLRNATNSLNNNVSLTNHYKNHFNAMDMEIISSVSLDYLYRWNSSEMVKGNHWKVFEMQGNYRTWYIGASVSFESVNSVMEYNKLLLRQFQPNNASLIQPLSNIITTI